MVLALGCCHTVCDRAQAELPVAIDSLTGFGAEFADSQSAGEPSTQANSPLRTSLLARGQSEPDPGLPLSPLAPTIVDPFSDALNAPSNDGVSAPDGLMIPSSLQSWQQEVLPSGLLYYSYLAGEKESRFALQNLYANGHGAYWEVSLGGRVGLFRWGTPGATDAEGWQLDMEGAAFPRLDLLNAMDIQAVDYRFGLPLTWRQGRWSTKFGYYHISSHLGDEYMLKNPTVQRLNYFRESIVAGLSYDLTPAWRVYGEVGYAVALSGGAKPLEFQFGTEYSPRAVSAPFMAINGHLREEFNFGGNLNALLGWQFRGLESGHRFRIGLQYYDGVSMQYSFFDKREKLYGLGFWFDY